MSLVGTGHAPASTSHAFAGQLAGLPYPIDDLSFVHLVVLVDAEVAHFLLLGIAGWDRTQRRAAEEGLGALLHDVVIYGFSDDE